MTSDERRVPVNHPMSGERGDGAMSQRLGIQLAPWCRSNELVALGERLSDVVDTVWVQDQMLARNVYASLAALAHAGCGVGTNVACPIGRNPIEMASAAAT